MEEKKITRYQQKRQRLLEYYNELRENFAITYSVEKTAKQFNLTATRVWQILREEENKVKV